MNVHHALERFASLLPFLALNKDIQQTEIEWATKFVDIPNSSKLRVLTGNKLLLLDKIYNL